MSHATTSDATTSEAPSATAPDFTVDLSGSWRVALDRAGVGEHERWYHTFARQAAPGAAAAPVPDHAMATRQTATGELALPGSVQEQGLGDPITLDTPWTGLIVDRSFFDDERYAPYRQDGNVSVPFWLQPHTYYRGAAWFQRTIDIPSAWAGRRIVLHLERVHWESTLWVDERRMGSEISLSTPHRYDLGELPAGPHVLTLRVDNRTVVDVGPNAHSISDHTQGNWNGVVGDLRLEALAPVTVRRITVVPDVARRAARVRIDLASDAWGIGRGSVTVTARPYNRRNGPVLDRSAPGEHRLGGSGPAENGPAENAPDRDAPDDRDAKVTVSYDSQGDSELLDRPRNLAERGMTSGGGHLDVDLPLGSGARTWDEFDPALYELSVELSATVRGVEHQHTSRTTFGLREIGTEGTQITVNGRPTFLRGTLESCVWPLTGYPPTDVEPWRRVLRICRAHGLNLVRFHSWCPPEAAFTAADLEGFYLQAEGPVWANQGAGLGEGRPVDRYLYEETDRILDTYGNHPSFIAMAHGNEPGGRDVEFLSTWVAHYRRKDPRRLYTTAAGWPAVIENDFDNLPDPRLHQWQDGLASRLNARAPETQSDHSSIVGPHPRPVVSHEIGQWCAYPDFAETAKYTGLMQARNHAIFADFLRAGGMSGQAEQFLHASGRLQLLCYKEEVEAALRTPGFAGFHLLGLNDFPGQGTALVGFSTPSGTRSPTPRPRSSPGSAGPSFPWPACPNTSSPPTRT